MSIPHAAEPRAQRRAFTDQDIDRLVEMYVSGAPYATMAKTLRRGEATLQRKLHELRRDGRIAVRRRCLSPQTDNTECDERHVEACIKAGGFPAYVEGVTTLASGRRVMALRPVLVVRVPQ